MVAAAAATASRVLGQRVDHARPRRAARRQRHLRGRAAGPLVRHAVVVRLLLLVVVVRLLVLWVVVVRLLMMMVVMFGS